MGQAAGQRPQLSHKTLGLGLEFNPFLEGGARGDKQVEKSHAQVGVGVTPHLPLSAWVLNSLLP